MSARSLFLELVDEHAAPLLKSRGFKKSGMNFGLRGDGVWGVLTFWRDRWNTAREVRFTVTLNVTSDVLRKREGWPFDPKKVPDSSTSHWHTNIGPYLKQARQAKSYDRLDAKDWWEIRNQRDYHDVTGRVLKALEQVAIPELRRRQSLEMIVQVYRETGDSEEALSSAYWLGWVLMQMGDRKGARKLFREYVRDLEEVESPATPRVMKELVRWGMA